MSDSQVETDAVLYFTLGGKSKGSLAKDLHDLRSKLEAAKNHEVKEGKGKPVKDDIKVLKRLLAGEFPLLARADLSADILQLLKLKNDFGFSLALVGGLDVADQLKAEKVVVIVETMRNLPEGFDYLYQRLDTDAKLHKVWLEVILADRDTHNIQQLRFHVGNTVAHALASYTRVRHSELCYLCGEGVIKGYAFSNTVRRCFFSECGSNLTLDYTEG